MPRRPAQAPRGAVTVAGCCALFGVGWLVAASPVLARPGEVVTEATGTPPAAASAPTTDLVDRPADLEPAAARSLLLDIVRAGQRLVAVGERGHVLLSDDDGRHWRQAKSVPSRTLLTAVAFADARQGWAVGHDEIILHTADGGETWSRQHYAPEAQQPLLDLWFADARRGIAVGAYKSYYVTGDGGATWTRTPFEPAPPPGAKPAGPDDDIPPEYHLNRITGRGDRLYIAAEAGQLYRSDDAGHSWRTLRSPYNGSFFGLLPLAGDAVLAFGLRGNLFRSDDGGVTWRKLESGTTAMLTDGFALPDGRLALVGLSGTVLVSADAGIGWTLAQQEDRKGLSAALPAAAGALVAVGEDGARRIALPGPEAAK